MHVTEDKRPLQEVVLTRALHLNAAVQGIATGLVAGVGVFVATNWLVLKGGEIVGPHLALLGQFFPGYRVTFLGSLIGFVYAFAAGFGVGYLVARTYNRIVDRRDAKRLGLAPRREVRAPGEPRQ